MQNKYTHATRGLSLSLSLSLFSLYLSLKRKNEQFFARFSRSFDRGARFAFASRVFSSSFVRAAQRFFSRFLFLVQKGNDGALSCGEFSPFGLPPKSDRVLLYPRASSCAGIDRSRIVEEDIRDEKHSMRANRPRYASLSLRGGGSNVVVVVGKDHFFIVRESSATAVRPFFFHFCGSPPDTPFWGF